MKRFLFFAHFFMTVNVFAQQGPLSESNKVYKMELNKTASSKLDGYIKNITDSLLYYTTQKCMLGSAISLGDPAISYADIQSIRLKRKGGAGRGALIGCGIGFASGFIVGLAHGDDPKGSWFSMSASEKGIALGLLGAAGGTMIGLVVGALSSNRFDIRSQKANFMSLQTFLAKKTRTVQVNY